MPHTCQKWAGVLILIEIDHWQSSFVLSTIMSFAKYKSLLHLLLARALPLPIVIGIELCTIVNCHWLGPHANAQQQQLQPATNTTLQCRSDDWLVICAAPACVLISLIEHRHYMLYYTIILFVARGRWWVRRIQKHSLTHTQTLYFWWQVAYSFLLVYGQLASRRFCSQFCIILIVLEK